MRYGLVYSHHRILILYFYFLTPKLMNSKKKILRSFISSVVDICSFSFTLSDNYIRTGK